ncbi:LPXTG cell wall anchor domain-containing protein, partial [Microvirga sp. 3-52]|nr:LPXTG cell wall anchor domain-containing protein [Microvirga sp. 3-52]
KKTTGGSTKLPKTATSFYSILLIGFMLTLIGIATLSLGKRKKAA